jgi:trimeric autotransporter adhesin
MPLHRVVAAVLAAQLALAGCASDPGGPPAPATIVVHASLTGTLVTTVVVEVSASDIPVPLVFNLTVANGVANGVLTLPSGSDRTIAVRAYDAGGIQTHSGTTTIDVQPGATVTLSLTLTGLVGGIDITVTLGHVTITVSPPSGSVAAGATFQLAATITDEHGAPVAASVVWATANPAVATVDGNGLVTGVATGQTNVVATFGGAAGHAVITVTGP